MARLFKRGQAQVALPPGSLIYSGEPKTDRVRIRVIDYDDEKHNDNDVADVAEALPFRDTATVSWINVEGLHDLSVLEKLGGHFGLHPLVMEDILNTNQRAKIEEHRGYLFIVARMLFLDDGLNLSSEQVSFVLGERFLLTFQEKPGDVFDPVRLRVERGKGYARKAGGDYLLYALLDAIVDNYFVLLERFATRVDDLEEAVSLDPESSLLNEIHERRRQLIGMRRNIWPLREVASTLQRFEGDLVKDSTRVFIQDVYDHVVQVMDAVESLRDMLASLQDLYLSGISNRTNDVMKVLTIISTIFVPLTFLAGIYGMNFQHMPELGYKWGYPILLAVMALAGGGMIAFLRSRKWL